LHVVIGAADRGLLEAIVLACGFTTGPSFWRKSGFIRRYAAKAWLQRQRGETNE